MTQTQTADQRVRMVGGTLDQCVVRTTETACIRGVQQRTNPATGLLTFWEGNYRPDGTHDADGLPIFRLDSDVVAGDCAVRFVMD